MPILGSSLYSNAYGKSQQPPFTPIASVQNTQDTFVVRYSLEGQAQWSARIASTGIDTGYGISSDSDGNVYVVGQTGTTNTRITAYNSDGTEFGPVLTSAGANDVFLVKYHSSGAVQWISRVASSSTDIGYAVACDLDKNVIIVGQAGSGTLVTAYNSDGTAFGSTFTAAGADAFIAKYSPTGSVQFLTRISSTATDIAYSINVDILNGFIVVGQGGSGAVVTAYNSGGTAFATTITNSGGTDAFVVRYNSAGFVGWVGKVASTGGDIAYGVTSDNIGNYFVTGVGGSGVSVIATGSTGSVTVTNSGNLDAFLIKYTLGGVPVWGTKIGGSGADTGYAVTTDSSANIYVTSNSTSTVTVYNADGSAFSPTLPNAGSLDAILVKYNGGGFAMWAARVATSSANEFPTSIVTDSSDNVYICLYTSAAGTITGYNANGSAFGTQLTNIGGGDACIVKYNSNGDIQWMRRIAAGGNDTIRGLTLGKNNDLYTIGTFTGSYYSMYGQSSSLFSVVPNSGTLTDGIVVKYNRNGAPQWVGSVVSLGDDAAFGVASDSLGNVYVTGNTGSSQTTYFVNADNTVTAGTDIIPSGNDVYLAKYNANGTVQWSASLTSSGTDIGYSTATDSNGNVYITGSYSGTLTAKNSNGTSFGTTITTGGGIYAFLVKYDSSGFVQWIARMGGIGTDIGYNVTIDSNNDVYVAGRWDNTAASFTAFNSNGTSGASISQIGSSGTDAFLVKYNSSGTVQWMARIGSTASDTAYAVTTDPSGNVYIAGGGGSGTVTAYNQGISGASFGSVANAGGGDAFIVKYNSSGAGQWITRIGGSTFADVAYGISTDSTGNVYVLGTCAGTVTAYNADGTTYQNTVLTGSLADAFLVKYNTSGRVQWVSSIYSSSAESTYGVAVDKRGNVYIVGQFGPAAATTSIMNSDGSLFSTLMESCAIVKYDTHGFGLWAQTIRGTTTGIPLRGVSVDQFDNVYVCGNTQSGEAITVYKSDYTPYKVLIGKTATQDSFVAKYSQHAEPQWITKITSSGTTNEFAYSVSTDSSGNCYVSGVYSGEATVWNADGTVYGTLTNSGDADIFLIRYKPTGFVEWVTRIISTGGVDTSFGLTVDSSNNIYVIGHSNPGNVIAYNSDGSSFTPLVTGGTAATSDAYIIKYNLAGAVQWTALIASTESDLAYGISSDLFGNIYVCGSYSGATLTAYNSDGSAFATTVPLTGAPDIFLAKYNSSGFVQWIASVRSGYASELPYSVATDSIGNVYLTIQTIGTTGQAVILAYNADGSNSGLPSIIVSGNTDGVLIKYNSAGTTQWMAKVGSTGADSLRAVATDPIGNVYVTGTSSASTNVCNAGDGTSVFTVLTNSGGVDVPVVKYDTNGMVQWAARIASTNTDTGYGIKCDSAGNVYVTGTVGIALPISAYNADGTLSVSSNFSTNSVNGNAFLVKYSPSGVAQWISALSAVGNDDSRGIAIDSSNNVYIAGMYTTSALVPESS